MEAQILSFINFNLTHTSAYTFLELIQQKINLDSRAFCFARYILENSLLDTDSLSFTNLTLASGSIFLVNRIFKNKAWGKKCEFLTGISLKSAKVCAKKLYCIMQKLDIESFTALKRKFSTKENFEVSKYKIEKVKTN